MEAIFPDVLPLPRPVFVVALHALVRILPPGWMYLSIPRYDPR
jgi:hypothetical protein